VYTNYFKAVTKSNGWPNLNGDQAARMMNIACCETSILDVENMNVSSLPAFNLINTRKSQLVKLTKDLSPKVLMEEMLRLSQNQ